MNKLKMKIINHNILLNVLVILSFIIYSLLNILLLIHYHSLPNENDIQFHWQRIAELFKSNNIFPIISTNAFSGNGSAVMSMYPYLLLYPFVFIYHMVKSTFVSSIIINCLNTFIALIISFYSSRLVNNNNIKSYIFSLLYVFSTSFLTTFYMLGMNYSAIFLPLVIFGFIRLLESNTWLELSIGMTLVIYSDVLASAFVTILLFLLLLINYKFINLSKIVSIIKAVIIAFLLSSSFILPAIKLMLLNKLHMPYSPLNMTGIGLFQGVKDSIAPFLYVPTPLQLSLIIILGVVAGVFLFKKMSVIIKKCYLFSILVIFVSSKYFPWHLFAKTSVNILQFPGRLLIFPQVILSYVLALFIYKLVIRRKKGHLLVNVILVTCVILGIQLFNQKATLTSNQIPRIPIANNLINNKLDKSEATNYYPASSLKYQKYLLNDEGYCNKHIIKFNQKGNGNFIFRNDSRTKKLYVPFLYYRGIKYRCYINGKLCRFNHDKNHIIFINNVRPGRYHLLIQSENNIGIFIISKLLTITGFLILIIALAFRNKKYHKMNII